jgi:hypothetical protein
MPSFMNVGAQKLHRRFRFRLRTLLLVPVVFAVAWWWITWPNRTLRDFNHLVASGQLDAAGRLVVFDPDYRLTPEQVAHQLRGQPHTNYATRTLSDVIFARLRYKLAAGGVVCWVQNGSKFEHRYCDSVTVERGAIKYKWGLELREALFQRNQPTAAPPRR